MKHHGPEDALAWILKVLKREFKGYRQATLDEFEIGEQDE